MEDDRLPLLAGRNNAGFGHRHVISLLIFLAEVTGALFRTIVSVAIVAMVTNNARADQVAVDDECPQLVTENDIKTVQSQITLGEFDWNANEQGLVLGAFYCGYVVSTAPGGLLVDWFGAKRLVTIALAVTSALSAATPAAVRAWDLAAFIVIRLLQGLVQGVIQPAAIAVLAKWVPLQERSTLVGFATSGMTVGIVIALFLGGELSTGQFLEGWPAPFYLFSVVGFFVSVLCWFFLFDTPSNHPWIGKREAEVIKGSMETLHEGEKRLNIPWFSLLTSLPAWSILVVTLGHSWGLYTILTELPTYLHDILHYSIESAGLLSALAYLLYFLVSIGSTIIADWMLEKFRVKTTTARKIFNSLAHFGAAMFMLAATVSGCLRSATVVFLLISNALLGAAYASYVVNYVDISPNFAALLFGVGNAIGSLTGIAVPLIVGVLINDMETLSQWNIVFYITAAIFIFDNGFYLIFSSGEEQPWNRINLVEGTLEESVSLTQIHSSLTRRFSQP